MSCLSKTAQQLESRFTLDFRLLFTRKFSDVFSVHLELLATLDFAYRWVKASGGSGPWKDRAVTRFIEIKKEKFAKPLVEKTYDGLVVAGLFEQ